MSEQDPVKTPIEGDLNLIHLQAELARIDVMIRRAVYRWQLAGQDPNDTFRGLYLSDSEINRLTARSFGVSWGQLVTLSDEEVDFVQAEAEATHQALKVIDQTRARGQMSRLHYLTVAFGLNRFELNAFLICLAPTLDLQYERFYSYLQDDVTRKRPTVDLILNMLSETSLERLELLSYFSDEANLIKYRLLEWIPNPANLDFASQSIRPEKTVVNWLLGEYQPYTDLGPSAVLTKPAKVETDLLLASKIWPELDQANLGTLPVIAFYGPDETCQDAAVRLLAAKTGRLLLTVKLVEVIKRGTSPLSALKLALRDARLIGAIPYLTGWDAYSTDGALLSDILPDLWNYPDLVIVAGQKMWQAEGIERQRSLLWFEFPHPAYAQRLLLWQHFLQTGEASYEHAAAGAEDVSPSLNQAEEYPPEPVEGNKAELLPKIQNPEPVLNKAEGSKIELEALAGQFALDSGRIRDVVATARDRAGQRQETLTDADLFMAARNHSNPRLSSLARKITPRYDWDDIILSGDQLEILHEVVSTVRGRPLVLEVWGVGQKLASSKGITILFAGPPGTGKTMGAEIVARELGLDLYKIDLSSIVSKYIGETEKNLEQIFSEAQSGNAILFFDEADAIFGKRSEVKDARDRYANIEVSYLLQRMEAYDGVTILATNIRSNLDEAFTRRLQFAIDFPFPDENDRLRIWQTLFPPGVPAEPNLDFELMARRFKLAGGNIRNIIVNAAYLAAADGGRVTMNHLLHGTRRELQKMGRLIDKADMKI